jgi:hypothetical protein
MSDTTHGQRGSPYARQARSSPQPGGRQTCELCERTTVCIPKYGLSACPACHDDLLPGAGV